MEKEPQKLVPTSSVTLNFANLKKYVNPQAKKLPQDFRASDNYT